MVGARRPRPVSRHDWIYDFRFTIGKLKMKLSEVIGYAFKIGWNHKVLWLWQIIPSISVIFVVPLFFIYYPLIQKIIIGPELQLPIDSFIAVSGKSIFFLFLLSYVILGILIQITTIYSVITINNGAVKLSFKDTFRKSLHYFWRVVYIYFIIGGILLIVNFIFSFIVRITYKYTYTFPDNLVVFFSLILLPIMFTGIILIELSQSAIIVDDMSLFAAISHPRKIFKKNLLRSILLIIILYYGLSILFALLMFPFLFVIPLFILFSPRLLDANTIVFILFFVIIPFIVIVVTFLNGLFISFCHCTWTLAYLRMNQTSEPLVTVG